MDRFNYPLPVECRQGDTFGPVAVAFDQALPRVVCQVRAGPADSGAPVLLTLCDGPTAGPGNAIGLTAPRAATLTVPEGLYLYSVQATLADGSTETLFAGPFPVSADVTRVLTSAAPPALKFNAAANSGYAPLLN